MSLQPDIINSSAIKHHMKTNTGQWVLGASGAESSNLSTLLGSSGQERLMKKSQTPQKDNVQDCSCLYISPVVVPFGTLWQILGESFGIVHSLLPGCVRVQMCPHVLDLQLQIYLGSLFSALKHTCYKEMCFLTHQLNIV